MNKMRLGHTKILLKTLSVQVDGNRYYYMCISEDRGFVNLTALATISAVTTFSSNLIPMQA